MRAQIALGPSQVHVKGVNIDLDDRIRALIKAIVDTTDRETLQTLGAELERLLALERTLTPIYPSEFAIR
jgi:hypothetical protein